MGSPARMVENAGPAYAAAGPAFAWECGHDIQREGLQIIVHAGREALIGPLDVSPARDALV